jgi:geranylgeranyl pyrophosphate synthase
VERGIDQLLPAATTRPARLHTAMRYSLQAGGKRLRPVLVLAAAALFPATDSTGSSQADLLLHPGAEGQAGQGDRPDPLPAAVAMECVHTYSLIHDDLPCMDNDDLRRGRPTAHRAFDEATALLAGDALLTHAFALLAAHYAARPVLAIALTRELADAAGSQRLIGGQMEDLLAEKKTDGTADELEFIHRNKTAAMIEAAFAMGALIGAASPAQVAMLRTVGRHVGLAFQIVDDILDATADTATLGKTAGKDAKAGKITFVRLHGLETSRRLAEEHSQRAVAALRTLPADTAFLGALIETTARRGA